MPSFDIWCLFTSESEKKYILKRERASHTFYLYTDGQLMFTFLNCWIFSILPPLYSFHFISFLYIFCGYLLNIFVIHAETHKKKVFHLMKCFYSMMIMIFSLLYSLPKKMCFDSSESWLLRFLLFWKANLILFFSFGALSWYLPPYYPICVVFWWMFIGALFVLIWTVSMTSVEPKFSYMMHLRFTILKISGKSILVTNLGQTKELFMY